MRHLLAVGGIIFICLIVLPGFWLAKRSRGVFERGILSEQMDRIVSRWNAGNEPSSNRLVDLVISEAEEEDAAEVGSAEKPSAYTSDDLEVLARSKNPSALRRAKAWFGRTFFRKTLSAEKPSALAKTAAARPPDAVPAAAVWTAQIPESVTEDEMSREVMRAVLKAEEALGEVSIIASGRTVIPVLNAIRKLKKIKLPGGRTPGVKRLLAVDMNRQTLKRIDSGAFSSFDRPDNLREIVFLWNPPSDPKRTSAEVHSAKFNGKKCDGAELRSMAGGGPAAASGSTIELAGALGGRLASVENLLAALLTKREAAKKGPEIGRTSRDLMGRSYVREDSGPADSLSAIDGGWLKEERKKTGPAAAPPPAGRKGKLGGSWAKSGGAPEGKASNCQAGMCNWWDAKAYCGGRLPSVAQLQGLIKGDRSDLGMYWSSEEIDSITARIVYQGGDVNTLGKKNLASVQCP